MMRRLALVSAVFLVLALAPRPAHAQTFFAPFLGFDFGGDAGNCPSVSTVLNCTEKRTAYGFGVGHLSHGIFGFEEEFSYAPDFFGSSQSFGTNSVLTLMSNLVVAVPAGPVHPYLTGGVGLMRTKVELTSLSSVLSLSNSSFAYNIGGGVMVFLPSHLGLRVDYRNIRSASDFSFAGFTIPSSKLNFSRIAFALVLH